MQRKQHLVCGFVLFFVLFLFPQSPQAKVNQRVNSRSAILIDMDDGSVLFEQNADAPIAPASLTKILTLYLVFEAIKEGQVHLSDRVEVSKRAASTPASRMGLKARTRVSLEELIKGMAVVSGNDACVAAAEHISGNVERFVARMNAKARELGMKNSRFMTPNGLPAPGQLTTARDIAILSTAYLRRFPESLSIHSMQAYAYGRSAHHNANRLLGRCPGVDGLKTGFVCASGYNISATAKRGGNRILAVVLGARSPWIRLSETEKLIEAGFSQCGQPGGEVRFASGPETSKEAKMSPVPAKRTRAAYGKAARKSKIGASRKVGGAGNSKAAPRLALKPGKRMKDADSSLGSRGRHAAIYSEMARPGHAAVKANKSGKSAKALNHKADKPKKSATTKKSIESSKKKQTRIVSKKALAKPSTQAHASKKKQARTVSKKAHAKPSTQAHASRKEPKG